jgi:hypothetical protein
MGIDACVCVCVPHSLVGALRCGVLARVQDLDSLRAIQAEARQGPPRGAPGSGAGSAGRPRAAMMAAGSPDGRRDYLASTRSRMRVPTERPTHNDDASAARAAARSADRPRARSRSRSRSRSQSPRRRRRSPSPARAREPPARAPARKSPSPPPVRATAPVRAPLPVPAAHARTEPPLRAAAAPPAPVPLPVRTPPVTVLVPVPSASAVTVPIVPAAAATAPPDLNRLAARLMRAEMMGDAAMVADLQAQMAAARAAPLPPFAAASAGSAAGRAPAPPHGRAGEHKKKEDKGDEDGSESDSDAMAKDVGRGRGGGLRGAGSTAAVVVDARDEYGRPLARLPERAPDNRPKLGKVTTHTADGQRVRYFRDDDDVSLDEMVRRERVTSGRGSLRDDGGAGSSYDRQLAEQISRNTRYKVWHTCIVRLSMSVCACADVHVGF